ncbi:thiamine phosphate synthase [Arthrobacter sp. CAN_C5]|uniref:thiamine phosphate synthase n=1 Tax=Arthrobacter sp. CAN_C5 TaxID=2760706 RepID=UPI001AE279CD|nr:thiamine phosphate synthase [Arthrobacter sp. CAN_C5]MBP2216451.1 thiamine-phosphate diphosphorylase [Arthrobacter sp. CAN_C5]
MKRWNEAVTLRDQLSLYLVTDTGLCQPTPVADVVAAAVAGGATMVQVRDKNASTRGLLQLLLAVAESVGSIVPVLVDDRVDVFLAARARGAQVAGVHVGQSDLPVHLVRSIVGPGAIVGLSAATGSEIGTAHNLPASTVDYLGIGAIHATATKADHPDPLGTEGFGALASGSSLPCVAIGGIGVSDVRPLRDAGAAGVAVVSAVCASTDPEAAARELAGQWRS